MGHMNCTSCQSTKSVVIKSYDKTKWFLCKDCLAFIRYPVVNIKETMAMNINYQCVYQSSRSEDDFSRSVNMKEDG